MSDVHPVFPDTPPAMIHAPSGMRVWFTDPPGLVTQLTDTAEISVAMAEFIAGPVHAALSKLPRSPGQSLLFLHEWTHFRSYEPAAREILTDWAMSLRGDVGLMLFVISKEASSMVRMGIKVGTMTLKLAGIDSELVESIHPALTARGIQARI